MLFCLVGCAAPFSQSPVIDTVGDGNRQARTPAPMATEPVTEIEQPGDAVTPALLWLSPDLPATLASSVQDEFAAQISGSPEEADFSLAVLPADSRPGQAIEMSYWVYAVVVAFSNPIDHIAPDALMRAWAQADAEQPIWMSADTLAVLSQWWGAPGNGAVRVADEKDLLDLAWSGEAAWAIVPFERLEPRWRVLRIGNQSPLDPNFNPQRYALAVQISYAGRLDGKTPPGIPTNYRRDQLTVLAMSGVTALARRTAGLMNEKGVLHPGGSIGGWMREADITHISNEVSFNEACPPQKAALQEALFCSPPEYIRLLELVGTDVVELTGNHNLDRGVAGYLYTLDLYAERGWGTYGGGADLEQAALPLLVEHHGNRLAFLGCNLAGPDIAWASESKPGANPCNIDQLALQVEQLRREGYLPVVSLQAFETEDYRPAPMQRPNDYVRLAEAGAVVVSGSQAHVPQGFKFAGDGLIHYGLGNLFFDQTDSSLSRRAFIDRHIFYAGRYLGVELFPVVLEEYGRPTPMGAGDREEFLRTIFDASLW